VNSTWTWGLFDFVFFCPGYHRNHFEPKHSCTGTILHYLWFTKRFRFFLPFYWITDFLLECHGRLHLGALMYFPHGIPLLNRVHSWMAIKIHQLRLCKRYSCCNEANPVVTIQCRCTEKETYNATWSLIDAWRIAWLPSYNQHWENSFQLITFSYRSNLQAHSPFFIRCVLAPIQWQCRSNTKIYKLTTKGKEIIWHSHPYSKSTEVLKKKIQRSNFLGATTKLVYGGKTPQEVPTRPNIFLNPTTK
jgi:hypothetical protein